MGRWLGDALAYLLGAVGHSGDNVARRGLVFPPVAIYQETLGRIFNFCFLIFKVIGTLTLHWAD